MKKNLPAMALAACLFCSGCASVINGPDQEVSISSTPSGATITIDGEKVGTTPLIVVLSRIKRHRISLSSDGYLPCEIDVSRKVSALIAGDFVFDFGPLGILSDAVSGSMYKLSPGQVDAALRKGPSSNP